MGSRFEGKVAIVTGAAQGIGYEICKRLVQEGALVLLNDIDSEMASQSAESLQGMAGRCLAFGGDSSKPEVIAQMCTLAFDTYRRLDIVVANAGITLFGNFLDYSPESFRRVMEVNLFGSFFLAQEAARTMLRCGKGGSILLMSSVTGHQAHKNLAAYGMSKAALEMLAKQLVVELSQWGIRVNTVAPGATLTERTAGEAGYEKTWSSITPLGKPASTLDIAEAVLFLVSEAAGHITGQSLVIDGGWTSVSPSPY